MSDMTDWMIDCMLDEYECGEPLQDPREIYTREERQEYAREQATLDLFDDELSDE